MLPSVVLSHSRHPLIFGFRDILTPNMESKHQIFAYWTSWFNDYEHCMARIRFTSRCFILITYNICSPGHILLLIYISGIYCSIRTSLWYLLLLLHFTELFRFIFIYTNFHKEPFFFNMLLNFVQRRTFPVKDEQSTKYFILMTKLPQVLTPNIVF